MSDPSTRCVHGTVSGVVQGVGYRAALQREAAALGLMGWVRNLPDGRVEFVAAGAPGDLERLIVWAGRGPARAQVAEVSVVERSAPADLGPFVVRFFGEP